MTSNMSTHQTHRQRFSRELHLALTVDEVREVYFAHARDVLPADGVGFYRFRELSSFDVAEKRANLSKKFISDYEGYGRGDDPVLDFVLEHHIPFDSSRLPVSRWAESGARMALANEGLEHSLEAPLILSGSVVGTINFARTTDSRAFQQEDLISARFINEHLNLAIERATRHEQLGSQVGVLQGALEHFSHGVLVSSMEGIPLYASRQAERILHGSPVPPQSRQPSTLNRLVTETISDFSTDGHQTATGNLRDDATGERVALRMSKVLKHNAIVTLIYECSNERTSALPAWGVLSPREQEIATMVSQGLTTKQIASKAFISENTAKQHLKRIFAKTDVHSRAELVQLIWSSHKNQPHELGSIGLDHS